AMVVFLHDGFGESKYCDQEVGWVMGRHRPILPLAYGTTMPHGFMSTIQAQKVGTRPTSQVAKDVMTWLIGNPALHG
ncbi:hypothetical protein, partial [Salinarimonas soli]|uniref:hypothetical protein n=1 Tax=Salinarimonas soli TaxID=1638099 RepID=UPI001AED9D65